VNEKEHKSKQDRSFLVLSRAVGERIFVGDDIELVLAEAHEGRAKIAISAPRSVQILRDNAKIKHRKHG